jgi:hypothetical protein
MPKHWILRQGWSASEADNLLSFESVTCPLCQQPHMVNVKTGRVAGSSEKDRS